MSGLIRTQTWRVGDTVTVIKDDSWHGLPVGTKVQVTTAQLYSDVVGQYVPLSTEVDPYSYGVTAVEPAEGVDPRERFLCSDEIKA